MKLSSNYESQESKYFDKAKLQAISSKQKKEVLEELLQKLIGKEHKKLTRVFTSLVEELPISQEGKKVQIQDILTRFNQLRTLKSPLSKAFFGMYKKISNKHYVATALLILHTIQTTTISYITTPQSQKGSQGRYLGIDNSIQIYLDNFSEGDYFSIEETVYHEIHHPISRLIQSLNQPLVEGLGEKYYNSLTQLIDTRYELITASDRQKKEKYESVLDYLDALLIQSKKVSKEYEGEYNISDGEMAILLEKVTDEESVHTMSMSQLLKFIQSLKPKSDNGVFVATLCDFLNIELTPEISHIVSNTIQYSLYPEFIKILWNETNRRIADVETKLLEAKISKENLKEYLSDDKKYLDEFRTRILTMRSFLPQRYMRHTANNKGKKRLIKKLNNTHVEVRDEETLKIEVQEQHKVFGKFDILALNTESQRRNFIQNYNGLEIIEDVFSIENRFLIEAFFVPDADGNDQVNVLVSIWNGMVYQEDASQQNVVYG